MAKVKFKRNHRGYRAGETGVISDVEAAQDIELGFAEFVAPKRKKVRAEEIIPPPKPVAVVEPKKEKKKKKKGETRAEVESETRG